MKEQEAKEVLDEKIKLQKEYEYKINVEEEKNILKIEAKSEEIIFILESLNKINNFNYFNKFNYNEIINILNLPKDENNEIIKILNYINIQIKGNKYKIINGEKCKKLIIDKNEIILKENLMKDQEVINILIKEINILKEENLQQNKRINDLIKINEEKNNEIKNLERKYDELKENFDNLEDEMRYKDEINLVYHTKSKGDESIFGEIFVENNKENIDLIINENKSELVSNLKLKKGDNHIKLVIKNKLINLGYMF